MGSAARAFLREEPTDVPNRNINPVSRAPSTRNRSKCKGPSPKVGPDFGVTQLSRPRLSGPSDESPVCMRKLMCTAKVETTCLLEACLMALA